jgi:hypothetical protein
MITYTENSVSPASRKRHLIQDGDQIFDKILHQEEENTNGLSFKQSNQTLAMNIQTFAARCAERENWRLVSIKKEYA